MSQYNNLGTDIRVILQKEVGEKGLKIFYEQCKEMRVQPEQLRVNDLLYLSQRITRALRPIVGDEKSQQVGKDIQMLKLLSELEILKQDASDPGRDKKELEIYSKLANISFSGGDWDTAYQYYKKAMRLGKLLNDKLNIAEAYRGYGQVFIRQSKWDDAIENLQQGYMLSKELDHTVGVINSYRGLGYAFWRMGEFDKALNYYDQAKDLMDTVADKNIKGVLQIEYGLVYHERGDLALARDHYEKSIEFLKEEKNYIQVARAYNNIGDAYVQEENYDKAFENFDRCNEIAVRLNNSYYRGWSQYNKAYALVFAGRPEEALELLEEAIILVTEIKDDVGICSAHKTFGLAYSALKEWDKADKSFRNAEDVAKTIKTPLIDGDMYREWALMHLAKGDKGRAKELLNKSLKILSEIGATEHAKKTEKELAKLK